MKTTYNIEASANKVYIEDKCNVANQLYNKKLIDYEKEQTHDMANRFRNRASLFVLATWTLGNHVAPDREMLKMMLMMMLKMMLRQSFGSSPVSHLLPLVIEDDVQQGFPFSSPFLDKNN